MTEKYDGTVGKEALTTGEQAVVGVGVDEAGGVDAPPVGGHLEVAASAADDSLADDRPDAAASDPNAPEPSTATEGGGEESPETQPSKMAQYDETFVTLEPGQIVTGRVVQVGADEVMVDVGYKSEGRIPLHELGLKSGQTPADAVSVGDEIAVYVLKVEDQEGNVLLSKRRADARAAWERLEAAKESGAVIEAPVTERVKGGLLVDVGVRGFVPASHVARNYVEDLEKYVGETLRLKVIELDRQRNNVVLSHKEVLEEEYEAAKRAAFSTLKEGSITSGVVRRITDFGAFVDIGGGVEGLLHVSEMAWSRVRHPSDVLSEGQEINVMVLKVDPESERISLSLKETLPDPWLTVSERYKVGETVKGVVTRVVDFGAFVKLEDGIEGLVHVSQLADHHVEKPEEVVKPDQEVEVRIVSLDEQRRRIGLSMRSPRPPQSGRGRSRGAGASSPPPSTVSGSDPTVKLGDVFEDLSTLFENRSKEE